MGLLLVNVTLESLMWTVTVERSIGGAACYPSLWNIKVLAHNGILQCHVHVLPLENHRVVPTSCSTIQGHCFVHRDPKIVVFSVVVSFTFVDGTRGSIPLWNVLMVWWYCSTFPMR